MDHQFTEQEEAVIAAFTDEVFKAFYAAAERHKIHAILSRLEATQKSAGFCGSTSMPLDFPDADKLVTISLRPKFNISSLSEVSAFAKEHVMDSGPASEIDIPPHVEAVFERHFRVEELKKQYVASLPTA